MPDDLDDFADLDKLAQELNALVEQPSTPARTDGPLLDWLQTLVSRNGSELFLIAGAPPSIRIDGRVTPIGAAPLDGVDVESAVVPFLRARHQKLFAEGTAIDAALRTQDRRRFRINLHRERGRAAACIRALPTLIPRLETLGFVPPIDVLTRIGRGLVLVCGPTGAGKSTTIAAIVQEIGRRERGHIITIEDPIEYEHPHGTSLVEQVEIGIDAPDFPTAVRGALRQAPDVVMVGEMRDPETIRIGLAAAETGHLVISTLHATDIASAVSRIIDSFPAERQPTIRQELASALSAVLTQTLLPRADGGGRVPAAELLMVGYGARQHIRKAAFQHLHQEITITRKHGSFTLEDSLARLVVSGAIERQQALTRAAHVEELESILSKQ